MSFVHRQLNVLTIIFFKKIGAVVSLVQGTDSNSTYKEQVTVDRTDAHAGKGRDRAVYVQVPEDVRSG